MVVMDLFRIGPCILKFKVCFLQLHRCSHGLKFDSLLKFSILKQWNVTDLVQVNRDISVV
jgi:hypothetical protein